MLSSLVLVGINSEQMWPYYVGLGCVASHLAWQVNNLHSNIDCNQYNQMHSEFKT